MPRLKIKELRNMSDDELNSRLNDLRAELTHAEIERVKGTIKKESGKMKYLRRDVARILTLLNERRKGINIKGKAK
jgi:large subunit ribosomal protein L29